MEKRTDLWLSHWSNMYRWGSGDQQRLTELVYRARDKGTYITATPCSVFTDVKHNQWTDDSGAKDLALGAFLANIVSSLICKKMIAIFNCYVLGIACVPHILFIHSYFRKEHFTISPSVLLGFPETTHSSPFLSTDIAHVVSLQLHYMG